MDRQLCLVRICVSWVVPVRGVWGAKDGASLLGL